MNAQQSRSGIPSCGSDDRGQVPRCRFDRERGVAYNGGVTGRREHGSEAELCLAPIL